MRNGNQGRSWRGIGNVVNQSECIECKELNPMATTLAAASGEGKLTPVHLHSKITEIGTLELWCISRDGKQKWKLEFNVRERVE